MRTVDLPIRVCLTACVVYAVGCAPAAVKTGPSYAELVVTYNAEVEALDRLEAKREKLVQQRAQEIQEKSGGRLGNLQGLLDVATELTERAVEEDPQALLDDLAGRSDKAQQIAGQLLEGLLQGDQQPTSEEATDVEGTSDADASSVTAEAASETEEEPARSAEEQAFLAELEALDVEIAKQKARVERARAARDKAEAAQGS